ncbi:MAG: prephenate dehydrogenase/arogenate dehydrogenase family protein [Desulfobacterales bacterium]
MIGIIGYGRFGRLAARFLGEKYPVFVCGRRDLSQEKMPQNVRADSFQDVCRQRIVIFCMPISSFKDVLAAAAPLIKPGALVADVCSVKEEPVMWMKTALPESVSILGTHPMFGPDSASAGLDGMKIALCRVRIEDGQYGKVIAFLKAAGLIVIEATPEEHDRQIAVSLALTHFIGRSLAAFGARELGIDTEGYKRLLHILDVVEHDTRQLFFDMHRYNPYAKEARAAFMNAMAKVEAELEP